MQQDASGETHNYTSASGPRVFVCLALERMHEEEATLLPRVAEPKPQRASAADELRVLRRSVAWTSRSLLWHDAKYIDTEHAPRARSAGEKRKSDSCVERAILATASLVANAADQDAAIEVLEKVHIAQYLQLGGRQCQCLTLQAHVQSVDTPCVARLLA